MANKEETLRAPFAKKKKEKKTSTKFTPPIKTKDLRIKRVKAKTQAETQKARTTLRETELPVVHKH